MLDFFSEESCTEKAVNYAEFGLIDIKDPNKPAFSTILKGIEWIAIVKNENESKLQFTGIDHNKYFTSLFKSESKCDGLLYYKDNKNKAIIFVELKSGLNTVKWVSKAKLQLLNTIDKFKDCHNISDFHIRKAFAANNIDSNTPVVRQNDIEEFFELGFDFYTQPVIVM
ncbi:MAG: hypothetical protein J5631_03325 [Spirochaetaceae bacterium]|nr:hypothetical protein [Spirochaetaceae bacterium]